jgi:hypothetical protein
MCDPSISLRPCKGSLQDLISLYGSDFYKSQEFVAAKQNSDKKYKMRKQKLINYLFENDLDLQVTTEMVYEWDGSELAKEKMRQHLQNKINAEMEAAYQKKLDYWKRISENTGIPLSMYIGPYEPDQMKKKLKNSDSTSANINGNINGDINGNIINGDINGDINGNINALKDEESDDDFVEVISKKKNNNHQNDLEY